VKQNNQKPRVLGANSPQGDIDAVRQLIAANANVNTFIDDDDSPLLIALHLNNTRLSSSALSTLDVPM
jgi:ankyrin repeat protein